MRLLRNIQPAVLAILLLVIGSLALATSASAQRRGARRAEIRGHRGQVHLVTLPRENVRVVVGKKEYFYSQGVFYHVVGRGYAPVAAPIGARITILPGGYTTLTIGGGPLFFYYGTYYRYDPADKSYVVVPPPSSNGALAQPAFDKLQLTDGSTMEGTFMGGNNASIQFQVNGAVQDIPIDQIVSITFAPTPPE